ncbi:MAG: kinase-like domain-containing protein, partial [Piptocephalis tieghemiana]
MDRSIRPEDHRAPFHLDPRTVGAVPSWTDSLKSSSSSSSSPASSNHPLSTSIPSPTNTNSSSSSPTSTSTFIATTATTPSTTTPSPSSRTPSLSESEEFEPEDDDDDDEEEEEDREEDSIFHPFVRGDVVKDTAAGIRLTILEELGRGAYAVVYRIKEIKSGKIWALKCLSKRGLTWEQLTLQRDEARLHKSLGKDPHLVHLDRYFETKDFLFLVLEYCPGPDLYDWITRIKEVFAQALEAVTYIHARGIFHRDIKPENIIVMEKPSLSSPLQVKLTDFGLATSERSSKEFGCGSGPYMSPECRAPSSSSSSSSSSYCPRVADMWSCGILLLTLLFRRTPWHEADSETDPNFRQYLRDPITYLRNFGCPPELATFLSRRVLCPAHQGRLTAAEWKEI